MVICHDCLHHCWVAIMPTRNGRESHRWSWTVKGSEEQGRKDARSAKKTNTPMIRFVLLLLGLMAPGCAAAERSAPSLPPPAFAVVFIDAETEKALGPFPYDRAVYAKGIEALGRAKARGVVLKFFIDRPKSAEGDAALAAAMTKVKVILQARLDAEEVRPNPLAERFILKEIALPAGAEPLSAKSGWLPLPAIAERAHDLGFLDSTDSVERVPVVERYGERCVKSLYTAALELAVGERAEFDASGFMRIGAKRIKFDKACMARVRLPAADELKAHSFLDLINGKIDGAAFKDRVVIVGYDGAKMEENESPIGKVKGHRLFCYQLFSLYGELAGGQP
jgi:adenylate cyclase